MPRAKKVPEVPVEIVNQINNALTGAMSAMANVSYAHVTMLSEDAQKHFDLAVVQLNNALLYFNRTYINKPKPVPRPAPVRTGKKKVHAAMQRVDQGGNSHEE